MQRRMLAIGTAIAAATALALTGCSGGGSASNSDAMKAKGPITIWYSNNEQEVQWGKAAVASWNKDHPDQQVKGQEVPAHDPRAAWPAGLTYCVGSSAGPNHERGNPQHIWVAHVRLPEWGIGLDIAEVQRANPQAIGCILGGHGITAWGETSEQCEARSLEIIRTAEAFLAEGGARP